VQIIPADPWVPWRYVDIDDEGVDAGVDELVERVCAGERAAVCELGDQPVVSAVLIRLAEDRYRFVLTNHHIVMDGWSLPIVVRELFASYGGQRLAAPAPYRRFVTWLAGRDHDSARAAWGRCWPVWTPPPWWARRAGWGPGGARRPHRGCPPR